MGDYVFSGNRRVLIAASGSYIPEVVVGREYFLDRTFLDYNGKQESKNVDGKDIPKTSEEVVDKLTEITGIKERRYVREDQLASDIATEAVLNMGIPVNRLEEVVDEIIVATDYGDVAHGTSHANLVPCIASKVKANLGWSNPNIGAYDIVQGCPGWNKGFIQGTKDISGGYGKSKLVIGVDTLSRIAPLSKTSRIANKDGMIYADGAGAVLLHLGGVGGTGVLSVSERVFASNLIYMQHGLVPENSGKGLQLGMDGNKVYTFALREVPKVVRASLDNVGLKISDVDMFLLHQANEKLDLGIMRKSGFTDEEARKLAPLTIDWLGNSSVATVPTLWDLVRRGRVEGFEFKPGQIVVLASVGAGMAINSVVYRMPEELPDLFEEAA